MKVLIDSNGVILASEQENIFKLSNTFNELKLYSPYGPDNTVALNFMRYDGVQPNSRYAAYIGTGDYDATHTGLYIYVYQLTAYQLAKAGILQMSFSITIGDNTLPTGTFEADVEASLPFNPENPPTDESVAADLQLQINQHQIDIDALEQAADDFNAAKVDKTTTIAGVDLSKSRTKAEMLVALEKEKVNNTPDLEKPVSADQQAAIDAAIALIRGGITAELDTLLKIKTYVDTSISDLINGAPEAYNTLLEIADELADNNGAIETILTELAAKANSTQVATDIEAAVTVLKDGVTTYDTLKKIEDIILTKASTIELSDAITALKGGVSTDYDTLQKIITRIDNIVTVPNDGNVEISEARTDGQGVEQTSLKDRLAADYNALNTKQVSNVIATPAENTILNLNNTNAGFLETFTSKGQTTQVVNAKALLGTNKLDTDVIVDDDLNGVYVTYNDTTKEITLNGVAEADTTFAINLIDTLSITATSYTLKFWYTSGTIEDYLSNGGTLDFGFKNSSNTTLLTKQIATAETQSGTVTATAGTATKWFLYMPYGTTFDNFVFKLSVQTGETAMETFEPYTWTPSPSPQVPSAINDTSYAWNATSCAKNKLNIQGGLWYDGAVNSSKVMITGAITRFTTRNETNFTHTVSAGTYDGVVFVLPVVAGQVFKYSELSQVISAGSGGVQYSTLSKIATYSLASVITYGNAKIGSITIPAGAKYLALSSWGTTAGANITVNQPQLELGSTATAFAPYTVQTLPYRLEATDVAEYANLAAIQSLTVEQGGQTYGIQYKALDTGLLYEWAGQAYTLFATRSLPDGKADEYNDNVLTKSVKKLVLTNGEGFTYENVNDTLANVLYFDTSNNWGSNLSNTLNMFCTIAKPSADFLSNVCFIRRPAVAQIGIRVLKSELTSLNNAGAVAWINAQISLHGNIEFEYELATPQTYQIKQYGEYYNGQEWLYNAPIPTQEGHTTVFTDAETPPILTVEEYEAGTTRQSSVAVVNGVAQSFETSSKDVKLSDGTRLSEKWEDVQLKGKVIWAGTPAADISNVELKDDKTYAFVIQQNIQNDDAYKYVFAKSFKLGDVIYIRLNYFIVNASTATFDELYATWNTVTKTGTVTSDIINHLDTKIIKILEYEV